MVNQWWYQQNGNQKGPVTRQELLVLVNQQFLNDETLVWQQGMPGWMKLGLVKNSMLLSSLPDETNAYMVDGKIVERKSWLAALLLCFFFGWIGVHRFYTGHIGTGIIQLITLGGFGIWTLIDFILIATQSFKDANGQPLSKA